MPIAQDQLPDDVNALKAIVTDQLARYEQLQADKQAVLQKIERLKTQVLTLQEQLNPALAHRYADSIEKIAPDRTHPQAVRLQLWSVYQDNSAATSANPQKAGVTGPVGVITVSKYQDALPLYRQETILKRIGVELPRTTLTNWMIQAGGLDQPLINLHNVCDKLLRYLGDGRLESITTRPRMPSARSWSAEKTGCSVSRSRA